MLPAKNPIKEMDEQRIVPHTISTMANRTGYVLMKVRLVRSYIAYDMKPKIAPMRAALTNVSDGATAKI